MKVLLPTMMALQQVIKVLQVRIRINPVRTVTVKTEADADADVVDAVVAAMVRVKATETRNSDRRRAGSINKADRVATASRISVVDIAARPRTTDARSSMDQVMDVVIPNQDSQPVRKR